MYRFVTLAAACALVAGTAAQSQTRRVDSPEGAAGNPDKIVCKTFTRIGTLAGRYRTCKTKSEWERERENARQVNISDSCATRYNGPSGSPAPGSSATYDC